jgi:exosortase A
MTQDIRSQEKADENGNGPKSQGLVNLRGWPLEGWPLALALLGGALTLTLALYFDSARSAVDLWWNRSAYNHGFLILPISLYLIWDKREALAAMTPRPDRLGLVVIAGFSFAWVLSRSAGINEGEHFALVGVIEGVVLAVLGRQLFMSMLLPMAYLWLMVPTGTVLYPVLQTMAHWLSVLMLELSGIPVFAEGYLIEVPIGLYDVAPGCSGLNFILASLALAPLYGYMMFDGMRKRLIAIAVMLGIAVLANGIRIYGIIALAEFTDKRIDIIDDHLLYGWGFFAVILALAGYIGSRYADPERPARSEPYAPAVHVARSSVITGCIVAMVALSVFPFYRMAALSVGSTDGTQVLELSGLAGDAVRAGGDEWLPVYPYATQTRLAKVSRGGVETDIFLAGYSDARAAAEMITSSNALAGTDRYIEAGGFSRTIESADGRVTWRFVRLRSKGGARLVARARQVEGVFVTSALKAKLMQAQATLLWRVTGSGVVLVSVPVTTDFEAATLELEQFLEGADMSGLFGSAPSQPAKR